MPKHSGPPLTKHTLLLFEGDYAIIRTAAGENGAAEVIRKLVRNLAVKVQGKEGKLPKSVDKMELDL